MTISVFEKWLARAIKGVCIGVAGVLLLAALLPSVTAQSPPDRPARATPPGAHTHLSSTSADASYLEYKTAPQAIGAPLACNPPIVNYGAITDTHSLQTGRLFRAGVPGVCGQSSPDCIATDITTTYPYQRFAFSNPAPQCVSVTIDASSCIGDLYSVAYLGSFNASNVCSNYLSQMGYSTGGLFTYSFMAPTGTFSIVNNLVDPGIYCPAYTLTVQQCAASVSVAITENVAGSTQVTADLSGTAIISYNVTYQNTGNYTAVVPSANVYPSVLLDPASAYFHVSTIQGLAGGVMPPGAMTSQTIRLIATSNDRDLCVPKTYTLTSQLSAQPSVYQCNWGNNVPSVATLQGTLQPNAALDEDRYVFAAAAGAGITVTVNTVSSTTTFDPEACISTTPNGACLLGFYADDTFDCDYPPPLLHGNQYSCPMFGGNLPASPTGLYYLHVGSASGAADFAGFVGQYVAIIEASSADTAICPVVQVLDNGPLTFIRPTFAAQAMPPAAPAIPAVNAPPVVVVVPPLNPADPSCHNAFVPEIVR